MRYQMQNKIHCQQLLDPRGQIVVRIKNRNLLGAGKRIIDVRSGQEYATQAIDRIQRGIHIHKYVMYSKRDTVAECHMGCIDMRQWNGALFPPKIDRLKIQTPYGLWTVIRHPNSSATIVDAQQRIADISPCFS